MRTISKGRECSVLRAWKNKNRTSPQNLHYDYLDGATRQAMLVRLVKEGGGLCAYTMKPIRLKSDVFQAHIEHLLPRKTHGDKSILWTNLVACIPQSGAACEFGAVRKGAYDPNTNLFLFPTNHGIASRFRYRESGEVEGLCPEAIEMIKPAVLNLNHAELVNDRQAKIRAALRHVRTAKDARDRARALRMSDRNGTMEAYCEAVAQVLDNYAKRLESRSNRLAGAKRN